MNFIKLKNIIVIILTFSLLFINSIKLIDLLFHNHDNFHCTAKNERHFHNYHEQCKIQNLELPILSIQNSLQFEKNKSLVGKVDDIYKFIHYFNNSKFTFSLRAPPNIANSTV